MKPCVRSEPLLCTSLPLLCVGHYGDDLLAQKCRISYIQIALFPQYNSPSVDYMLLISTQLWNLMATFGNSMFNPFSERGPRGRYICPL